MNDFDRVATVIRYLDEHHAKQPSLGELAAATGLSESHFHRLFHRWAGVTPKDFLQCLTVEHAKRRLRESAACWTRRWMLVSPGRAGCTTCS
jgi:AraC family transcriptional regulator of adaptative response/methylated-DNA-[protein]-cysteine methyltransferase